MSLINGVHQYSEKKTYWVAKALNTASSEIDSISLLAVSTSRVEASNFPAKALKN